MHLVKYLPPSRLSFLSDLLFRVTQPADLNDPFDLAPRVDRLVPLRGTGLIAAHFAGSQASPAPTPRRRLRFSDLAPYRIDPRREIEAMRSSAPLNAAFGRMVGDPVRELVLNRLGVFSASDNAKSSWMWSMYADSHHGFAIELDPQEQVFEHVSVNHPPFGTFRSVTYVQTRPTVSALELMIPFESWSMALSRRVLFTKSSSCRQEREWRMVLPLHDQEHYPHKVHGRLHLFKVCAAALRRVIVGARCTPEFARHVLALVRRNRRMQHVQIVRAELRKDSYGVRLELMAPERAR